MRRILIVVLALAVVTVARAADDDPEPPGGQTVLRKLQGKWTVVRRTYKGRDLKSSVVPTYAFAGDKVTMDNGRLTYVAKVKIDAKARPLSLVMTREDVKTTVRWAFKFENGALLAVANSGAKEDFSGNEAPVMVLERQK
jgi:uncharacterized protein (TIGR03067 family)